MPGDLTHTDWQSQRKAGVLWAVVAPGGTGLLRLDSAVAWTQAISVVLRPQRLVVLLESVALEEILALVRAGADGVLPANATPEEILAELRRPGTRGKDYFPDPQNWLGSLRRASEELLLIEDPKTQLFKLLRLFVSQLKVDRCSIMLLDDDSNLRLEAGIGLPGELKIGTVITPQPNSVSAWVLERRQARLVEGTLDPTASRIGRRALSAISAPLIAQDHLIGLVNFSSFDPARRLSSSDLAAAQVFASMLAMAIQGHRLFQENLAQERLSTIGRTMAHVSHSIKNILLIFNGANMILKKGVESNNLQMARDGCLMTERATRRLEGLIMDLLDYSKERKPDLVPTDVALLLQNVKETYFEPIRREGHSLEVSCTIDRTVLLDEHRLQLALFNLISNALDVMTAGGRIRLKAFERKETVVFRIIDDGPGISEENLPHIFEPFYSTKGSKGTGLGLAMVRKFTEENEGRVTAENAPGAGLAISMELPLIREEEDPASGRN
ncbi:MAG: hypothetical protein PWP23_2145 [Candidatus Sumerlaeota bacterium]|nr:hypothetical protein [Candidatus Sumerlaeota bacterium]